MTEIAGMLIASCAMLMISCAGDGIVNMLDQERPLEPSMTVAARNGIAFRQDTGLITGLAVNNQSHELYALDFTRGRISRFSEDGQLVSTFGEAGADWQGFDKPRGLCFGDSILYVTDSGTETIHRFTASGTHLPPINTRAGATQSLIVGPEIVTTGLLWFAKGFLVEVSGLDGQRRRSIVKKPSWAEAIDWALNANCIAVAPGQRMFFCYPNPYEVYVLDLSGTATRKFGRRAGFFGPPRSVNGVAFTPGKIRHLLSHPAGVLLVVVHEVESDGKQVTTANQYIDVFDLEGHWLVTKTPSEVGLGPEWIVAMCVDDLGRLYVATDPIEGPSRIVRYDLSIEPIARVAVDRRDAAERGPAVVGEVLCQLKRMAWVAHSWKESSH